MVKVAVDATPLLGARTGIGVAVSGLIEALAGLESPELDLIGFGMTFRGRALLRAELPETLRSAVMPVPAGIAMRLWRHWDVAPLERWLPGVDVVHGTNFVVPPARRAGRVVSVWDLTSVRYPQLCKGVSKGFPRLVERAVRAGAWVHTAAEYVAEEIVEHFPVPRDRVRVVAPGVAPIRPGALSAGPSGGAPPSRPPRADGRRYVLGLGTTEPRKDFPALVRAFASIAGDIPDLDLVIAGPPGWAESDLERAIAACRLGERVRRLGWVPDVEALIAGAEVFAYPSLYEGFGFPPLEAMAAGVPVVATRAGAVPEVVGDAALLVPVGDTSALGEAIRQVVVDHTERARLVELGRSRAGAYTWEGCAQGMLALYRDVGGGA